MTTFTIKYMTIKDPMGIARTRWYILEDGRPRGFYGYDTACEATTQAAAIAKIRSGQFIECPHSDTFSHPGVGVINCRGCGMRW